jgi:hypothetical protein
MLSFPSGKRRSTVRITAIRERFEIVIDDLVPGTAPLRTLGAGQKQQRAVRLNIDARPASKTWVMDRGKFGMPSNVEMPTIARPGVSTSAQTRTPSPSSSWRTRSTSPPLRGSTSTAATLPPIPAKIA